MRCFRNQTTGVALDDTYRLHGFGMARGKCRHFFRIGFACLGVGLRRNEVVVEILRGIERKYRQADHRGPPLFAIGQPEQKPETPDQSSARRQHQDRRRQREPPDDWHASRSEDYGL